MHRTRAVARWTGGKHHRDLSLGIPTRLVVVVAGRHQLPPGLSDAEIQACVALRADPLDAASDPPVVTGHRALHADAVVEADHGHAGVRIVGQVEGVKESRRGRLHVPAEPFRHCG